MRLSLFRVRREAAKDFELEWEMSREKGGAKE